MSLVCQCNEISLLNSKLKIDPTCYCHDVLHAHYIIDVLSHCHDVPRRLFLLSPGTTVIGSKEPWKVKVIVPAYTTCENNLLYNGLDSSAQHVHNTYHGTLEQCTCSLSCM